MSKRGGAPTPEGGSYCAPRPTQTVRFQGGRLGPQGIRTQPLSQSCFPD